jgi:SAM-dependent methyltransferase
MKILLEFSSLSCVKMEYSTWLFNRIAFFFQWFYKIQVRDFTQLLDLFEYNLEIPEDAKILDVGCGTGAFGAAFKLRGYDVIGVDIAKSMVKQGRKNNLVCEEGDILHGLPYHANEFDLVIMGSVLHGVDADSRQVIFRETSRLTKQKILFHDYTSIRKWYISFIEWIEHGDYFNFVRNLPNEFENFFNKVQIFTKSDTSFTAWYLCEDPKLG